MDNLTDDELLAQLGIEIEQKKTRTYSPREERIIAGFEDTVKFFEENGRAPQHGEQRDIFERLYAVRLDRLRELEECRNLLAGFDKHGLLDAASNANKIVTESLGDDELLNQLGVDFAEDEDITILKNVMSRKERKILDEIAQRDRCEDFYKFKPLFDQVENDIKLKVRETRRFGNEASISKAEFFILNGQFAYVAEVGETIRAPNGEYDARLRVIYSNGTESKLLRRSLQRALYKDEAGRRVTSPEAGPLFASENEEGDFESGTVYVLRSKSNNPTIAEHRDLVHKIGITGGSVESRISSAESDATYLLAGVEIVATYKLFNINRKRLEALIHKIFAGAQLDLEIKDRFGKPVRPKEWFLVPLGVIDEAIERIKSGTITNAVYDPKQAKLV